MKSIKLKRIIPGIKYAIKRIRIRRKSSFTAFRKAVRKAEKLSKENKRRYRIYLSENGYKIRSKEDFNRMKSRGLINRKMNVGLLNPYALYDTLTHENMHPEFYDRALNIKI